ncbi:uncharacterized protein LOC131997218 [Stomoxys calcitrans]|uniref:uncharacterized protein LOC131997218 n=1 Tax=Stomoxys calcitrans TaxID=35570 RepID=UPI0027E21BA4|nr:uncharacterized protein LOC131997218 [Stomoxys calcitrans]
MLPKILFWVIALNCLITDQAAQQRNYNVELRQFICKCLKSRPVQQLECFFKKLETNRYYATGFVMLNQQLDKNLDVQVKFNIGSGKKIIKFLDVKLNICDTLQRGASTPVIRRIIIELFKCSNLPRKCPIKPNFLFNASYILDDSYFPTYFPPSLDVNFTVDFYDNHQKFAILLLQGSIVPKTKINK